MGIELFKNRFVTTHKKIVSFGVAVAASLVAAYLTKEGRGSDLVAEAQGWLRFLIDFELRVGLYWIVLSLVVVFFAILITLKAKDRRANFCLGYDTGTLSKLTKRAEKSILLIGTSNYRIVFDDFSTIQKWLDEDNNRYFYALFLHPNSPHSLGRGRNVVTRSTNENIAKSYEHAKKLSSRHDRFVPVLYDGPYRYTAQCGDLFSRGSVEIYYCSTSHFGGIENGFFGKIPKGKIQEIYAKELKTILYQSVAHVPGNGVSIVSFVDASIDYYDLISRSKIDEIVSHCTSQYDLDDCHFESFEGSLHMTLSPLVRTNVNELSGYGAIGQFSPQVGMPAGFRDYLKEILHLFLTQVKYIDVEFDSILVDENGFVKLTLGSSNVELEELVESIRNKIREMIEGRAEGPEGNLWKKAIPETAESYFLPKQNMPLHVTVGRIVTLKNNRVDALRNSVLRFSMENRKELVFKEISLVNYAFKSFKRLLWRKDYTLGYGMKKER